MKTILFIAGTVVSSWIRDRVFYSILVVSVLILLCSLFLNEMIVGDKTKIVNDLGLSVMLFLGFFMTLFTVTTTSQDKTLYMILSRPIPRFYWIVGSYLGNLCVLLINTLILTALIYGLVFMIGGEWRMGVGTAVYLIYLELALLTAVCFFFSTVMTSPTLGKFCALCVFLVGHISEEVKLIMEAGKDDGLELFFQVLYYVLPNLQAFDVKTEAVHQLAIDPSHVLYASVYGVGYAIILLSLSSWAFSKSDM